MKAAGKKKGQSTVEYIILVAAVLLALIVFLGPQGPFVKAFNTAATAVPDWSDPAQADWLRQQGVTHVYVGPHSSYGYFDPAVLARNPQMTLVYGRDGVFIFAIQD